MGESILARDFIKKYGNSDSKKFIMSAHVDDCLWGRKSEKNGTKKIVNALNCNVEV